MFVSTSFVHLLCTGYCSIANANIPMATVRRAPNTLLVVYGRVEQSESVCFRAQTALVPLSGLSERFLACAPSCALFHEAGAENEHESGVCLSQRTNREKHR